MINYEEIIKKFGTPTYVYDINTLINRVSYLKSKIGNNTKLIYAIKANTFIAREIENEIDGFEICSPGEYEICDKLGIKDNKMIISGVYKDYKTINTIMGNKDVLKYTVESINQWHLLNELSTKYNKKIRVLIRLTSGNQFGVNEEELKDIIKNNNNELIEIKGIEYFSGTQKHSLKKIEREIDSLLELINDIETNLNFKVEELEYGPGFPIFYFQDEKFNEEEFLSEFNKIIGKVKNQKLSLEVGRSIAASCGSYLTSVVDLKTNKNGNFALVDGGIHHLVYYGQTMAMRIPYFDVYPKRDKEKIVYNLYGSLCTINDILVKNLLLPKLEINDTFIFKNVGAYSITEGISLFLSRDLPKVVIIDKDNNLKLVRDSIKTSEINFPCYEVEEK